MNTNETPRYTLTIYEVCDLTVHYRHYHDDCPDVTFPGRDTMPEALVDYIDRFAANVDGESCTTCGAEVGTVLVEDERGLAYTRWVPAYFVVTGYPGVIPGRVGKVVLCEDCADHLLG